MTLLMSVKSLLKFWRVNELEENLYPVVVDFEFKERSKESFLVANGYSVFDEVQRASHNDINAPTMSP